MVLPIKKIWSCPPNFEIGRNEGFPLKSRTICDNGTFLSQLGILWGSPWYFNSLQVKTRAYSDLTFWENSSLGLSVDFYDVSHLYWYMLFFVWNIIILPQIVRKWHQIHAGILFYGIGKIIAHTEAFSQLKSKKFNLSFPAETEAGSQLKSRYENADTWFSHLWKLHHRYLKSKWKLWRFNLGSTRA